MFSSCGGSVKSQTKTKKQVTVKKKKPAPKKKAVKKKVVKKKTTVTTTNPKPIATVKHEKLDDSDLCKKYAQQLNVTESHIKRNRELYQFIDEWIGTPYKYAGNDQNGVDCSGFVKQLCLQVFSKETGRDATSQYNQCDPISKDDLIEGDLVFFKIGSKSITHVGIYLANGKFVHSSTSKGVMISDLNEAYYKKWFFKGGRLKN